MDNITAQTRVGAVRVQLDAEKKKVTFYRAEQVDDFKEVTEPREVIKIVKVKRPRRRDKERDDEYQSRVTEHRALLKGGDEKKVKKFERDNGPFETIDREVKAVEKFTFEKRTVKTVEREIGDVPFYGRRLTHSVARSWANGFVSQNFDINGKKK